MHWNRYFSSNFINSSLSIFNSNFSFWNIVIDNFGITHSTVKLIPVELLLLPTYVAYSQKLNELCMCGCTPSGLDKIEFLQSHENQEIYQKAFDLIEHYFGVEEEDASLAPQVDQSQGQFIFQQQEGPMDGFQL